MTTDKEIARRAIELQNNAKDIPLMHIPGYMEWSRRKLSEGVSEALIAHLDSTSMWLSLEDIPNIDESYFEEMLEDLESEMDDE